MTPWIYGDHIAVVGHISTWWLCGWETPSSSLAPHWTNGVWTCPESLQVEHRIETHHKKQTNKNGFGCASSISLLWSAVPLSGYTTIRVACHIKYPSYRWDIPSYGMNHAWNSWDAQPVDANDFPLCYGTNDQSLRGYSHGCWLYSHDIPHYKLL